MFVLLKLANSKEKATEGRDTLRKQNQYCLLLKNIVRTTIKISYGIDHKGGFIPTNLF